MGLAAGSTAAVAFEPAGPTSPLLAPPNPGQLVLVLVHEREARRPMGHMFVEVEVAGSKTHHRAQRFSSGAREHFTGLQGGVYPGCECTCARSIPTLAQPWEISTFRGRT